MSWQPVKNRRSLHSEVNSHVELDIINVTSQSEINSLVDSINVTRQSEVNSHVDSINVTSQSEVKSLADSINITSQSEVNSLVDSISISRRNNNNNNNKSWEVYYYRWTECGPTLLSLTIPNAEYELPLDFIARGFLPRVIILGGKDRKSFITERMWVWMNRTLTGVAVRKIAEDATMSIAHALFISMDIYGWHCRLLAEM